MHACFAAGAVTGFHALTMQDCILGSAFELDIIVGWGCVQDAPRALLQAVWGCVRPGLCMMGSYQVIKEQSCCFCWWHGYVLYHKSTLQLQRIGMHMLCASAKPAFAFLQARMAICSWHTRPVPLRAGMCALLPS